MTAKNQNNQQRSSRNANLTPPPHSIEFEKAVLGSILIDPNAIAKVSDILEPESFYLVAHQWIFEAALAIHRRNQEVDFLNLCYEIDKKGRLEEVGGEGYIARLTDSVPTALHVESYARQVYDLYLRRKMILAAGQVAAFAYNLEMDIDVVLEKSVAEVLDVGRKVETGACLPMSEVVEQYFARIEQIMGGEAGPMATPTGFIDLDRIIGGLSQGDLFIIAARPGAGKTSLMLNIATHMVERCNKKVAFFSLEMGKEQLVHRLLSARCNIDVPRLRSANVTDAELDKVVNSLMKLHDLRIFLDDTSQLTPTELRLKAERLMHAHQIDAIFVDYLQLMRGAHSPNKFENRAYEIAHISASLKALARKLNIPVIVGSQLSRMVEQRADKRPMLSDLRESGAIEQDADVVLFIYRDEMYNPNTPQKNIAEIIVGKNRNGPPGKALLFFDGSATTFKNLAREAMPAKTRPVERRSSAP